MGYLRKALSISTLGLSNLVLEDETKQPVKSTPTRARKRSKVKAKAQAKARPGRPRGEHGTTGAKPRAAAKAKASSKAKASAKATTAARSKAASKSKASAGARTASRSRAAGSGRTAKAPAAKAKSSLAGRPRGAPTQPRAPEPPPRPEPAATAAAARTAATGSGVSLALERISALHEHGALTDREFAAAKARILGTSQPEGATEAGPRAFPSIEANVAAARRIDSYAGGDREPSVSTPPGAPGGI